MCKHEWEIVTVLESGRRYKAHLICGLCDKKETHLDENIDGHPIKSVVLEGWK